MLQLLHVPLAAAFLFTSDPVHGVALEASAPALPACTEMSVAALIQRPERRLGEPRRVTVQLHRLIPDWSPFLTRFDPDIYTCIEVWSDEQWLWIEEQYDAPIAYFFARKDTLAEATLRAAKIHDRLELDVVVREIQAGQAWIEIVASRWTELQTPEGTVLHAIRSLDMIKREGWTLALSEIERALRPELPPHVRAELESIKAYCETQIEAQENKKR